MSSIAGILRLERGLICPSLQQVFTAACVNTTHVSNDTLIHHTHSPQLCCNYLRIQRYTDTSHTFTTAVLQLHAYPMIHWYITHIHHSCATITRVSNDTLIHHTHSPQLCYNYLCTDTVKALADHQSFCLRDPTILVRTAGCHRHPQDKPDHTQRTCHNTIKMYNPQPWPWSPSEINKSSGMKTELVQ